MAQKRIRGGVWTIAWFTSLLAIGACQAVGSGVLPPRQPARGPGGSDYAHEKVTIERQGSSLDEYWIFTPDDPRPLEAPFVVFLHGWGGMSPRHYGAWIEHIVRKGHIIVFPRYQTDLTTPVEEMVPAAARAIHAAWDRLTSVGPVRPRSERIAWVGHSLGAYIAANLSAASVENGFAPPAILMAVQPGSDRRMKLNSLDQMPPDTLVLLVVGDEDNVVGADGAESILGGLGHIPPQNIDFVTVQSDRRGSSPLVADHFSPLAVDADVSNRITAIESPGAASREGFFAQRWRQRSQQSSAERYAPDALDYFGYWKLLDGLLDASFRGVNRSYALGDSDRQRFMGDFSDGVPVAPILVRPEP